MSGHVFHPGHDEWPNWNMRHLAKGFHGRHQRVRTVQQVDCGFECLHQFHSFPPQIRGKPQPQRRVELEQSFEEDPGGLVSDRFDLNEGGTDAFDLS